jgi:hypothetical protein
MRMAGAGLLWSRRSSQTRKAAASCRAGFRFWDGWRRALALASMIWPSWSSGADIERQRVHRASPVATLIGGVGPAAEAEGRTDRPYCARMIRVLALEGDSRPFDAQVSKSRRNGLL